MILEVLPYPFLCRDYKLYTCQANRLISTKLFLSYVVFTLLVKLLFKLKKTNKQTLLPLIKFLIGGVLFQLLDGIIPKKEKGYNVLWYCNIINNREESKKYFIMC